MITNIFLSKSVNPCPLLSETRQKVHSYLKSNLQERLSNNRYMYILSKFLQFLYVPLEASIKTSQPP